MSQLDILLPFSLLPPEHAADLMRALRLPCFALLAARGKGRSTPAADAFARALPHEAWLARRFGLEAGLQAGGSPPIAPAALQGMGMRQQGGRWFLLQPAHLHVARDHLVLTDWRQLEIADAESRALFDAARPAFEERGMSLLYGDARTWFLHAPGWDGLQTSSMDAACGHNIDIWQPKGPGERDWRKLQNELQMEWHAHPVNDERAARGAQPVNSAWLWGGGETGRDQAGSDYSHLYQLSGWPSLLGNASDAPAAAIVAEAPRRGLLMLDQLSAPMLAGDWSAWLAAWHAIEEHWLAPLAAALREGRLAALSIVLGDSARLLEISASRASLRKFWIQPSLSRLAP
jgi:hypothetical protein